MFLYWSIGVVLAMHVTRRERRAATEAAPRAFAWKDIGARTIAFMTGLLINSVGKQKVADAFSKTKEGVVVT